MTTPMIRADGLSKRYRIGAKAYYYTFRDLITGLAAAPFRLLGPGGSAGEASRDLWALKDVAFEVQPAEVMGIIGRNGAGKSTLLKILAGVTDPTEGRAEIRGRVGALLEVGAGFHPELTGRENIFLMGGILGMTRSEIRTKFDEIVEFSGIADLLDTPAKRYSSGMWVRLGFSVAAHLQPEILLVDEVLAVGDAEFQRKCLGKMDEVARKGRTVLFVSHNLPAIRKLCHRSLLLEKGRVAFLGPAADCVEKYLNGIESVNLSGTGAVDLTDRPERRGNGYARFVSVRLIGSDGVQRSHVEFQEPFTLEFTVKCAREVKDCYVSFSLLTAEGFRLLASHHPDTAPLRRLEAGKRYVLKCEVNPNFLRPGRYGLSLGIGDYISWDAYDWFPEAVDYFTVEPGSGRFGDWLDARRVGAVHVLYRWTWDRVEPD